MTVRAFRQLSRPQRQAFITNIPDPLTRCAFEILFLRDPPVSWAKAALLYGGGISPETLRVWVWRELRCLPVSAPSCKADSSAGGFPTQEAKDPHRAPHPPVEPNS